MQDAPESQLREPERGYALPGVSFTAEEKLGVAERPTIPLLGLLERGEVTLPPTNAFAFLCLMFHARVQESSSREGAAGKPP